MSVFSDAQIQEILRITMQSLGTHQYIGARYVPIFGRKGEDTWQWDNTAPYEPLTVVQYQGVSYTSRQYVPAGLGTPDQHGEFWAETGNYNAQIEAYRQEVLRFDDRITANSDAIADFNTELGTFENIVTANGWVTENRIASNAVTNSKIADGAVGNAKIAEGAISTPKIANGAVTEDKLRASLLAKINSAIYKPKFFEGAVSVAFGDSNTWGQMSYLSENTYQRICNMLGCSYHNFALSGAGFESTTSASVKTVSQQVADENTVDANAVKLVFLMCGINDYHYGSHEIATFQTAVSSALVQITNKYPNAIIVCAMDGGKQLPTKNMLLYQLGFARQVCNRKNCVWVPLGDLCTQSNLWYNQNHYNDSGCLQIAARVKAALFGGYFPPAGRRVEIGTYTADSADANGYYGYRKHAVTLVDPYTLVRTDKIEFFFDTTFGNVNSEVTNVPTNIVLADFPGTMPEGFNNESNFVDGFTVYRSSGGVIDPAPVPLNFRYTEPSDYQEDPRVRMSFRFARPIADITGHMGGFSKTFVTYPA